MPVLSTVDMVWPDQCNHHGTLFGGAGLAMLDRAAFIAASQVLRGSVVTAALDALQFVAPAPAGHLVECLASVKRRGRRSVRLGTELHAENLLTGERRLCLQGEFVMVRQSSDEARNDAPPGCEMDSTHAADFDGSDGASARVIEIVFPGHTNHRGVLHGGPALAWMAKAGFVAATRRVRRAVVMAGSGRLEFREAAHAGDVVEVHARVTGTGTRSIRVRADLWAESPVTGQRRACTSAELVYVALKE